MLKRRRSRRGVVLLLVLSLLVLFLLMGVSFMMVADQFMKSAEAQAEIGLEEDEPSELIELGFDTLLFGANDVRSPLFGHSLFEDMYGRGFKGTLSAVLLEPTSGNQLLELTSKVIDSDGVGPTSTIEEGIKTFPNPVDKLERQMWPYGIDPNINTLPDTDPLLANDPTLQMISPIENYYNGCVLTLIDGPAKNVSVRIVAYRYEDVAGNNNNLVLGLSRFDDDVVRFQAVLPHNDGSKIELPEINDRFVVNGVPFSGTGAGYDSTTGILDLDITDIDADAADLTPDEMPPDAFPVALIPNYSQYSLLIADLLANRNINIDPYIGGANESYDAADYQNMFLAAIIPSQQPNDLVTPTNLSQVKRVKVIPSFHRPALINYWEKTLYDDGTNNRTLWFPQDDAADQIGHLDFRRMVSFRPNPEEHPNFTGSNPEYKAIKEYLASLGITDQMTFYKPGDDGGWGVATVDDDGDSQTDELDEAGWPGSDDINVLVTGPWDVDNDGDGTPDSIWIDLGMPVRPNKDGRLVKPLFAILCTDLDGRVNVNAHGNEFQYLGNPAVTDETLSRGVMSDDLPKGSGFGPAEVDLGQVFTVSTNDPTDPDVPRDDVRRVLTGVVGLELPGRYGYDGEPGVATFDGIAQARFHRLPINFFNSTFAASSYFSPPNVRGGFAFGLDSRGALTFAKPTDISVDLRENSAYEMNLSFGAPRGLLSYWTPDHPYSIGELERLLRYNDEDASSLPSRLLKLSLTMQKRSDARRLVTTDSYDLPTANVLTPKHIFGSAAGIQESSRHFVELFLSRVAATDRPTVLPDIAELLPPEMLLGQRFDLNRAFGNGRDTNANGVVDEADGGPGHDEISRNEAYDSNETRLGLHGSNVEVDPDYDGVLGSSPTPDVDAHLARQLLARHLYVTLMTLKDPGHDIDFDGLPGNNSAAETARGLAQWAINVVDFRDADSIMTPFEYDENPFDGWDVDGWVDDNPGPDGDLSTTIDNTNDAGHPDRGLVWGCERPELLISSNLAWHDRRTEDLTTPDQTTGEPMNPDEDFDQRLRPRGQFFVELYNPWIGDTKKSAELYVDYDADGELDGVELNRLNAFSTPVWRMLVIQGGSMTVDPDDPTATIPAADIDRSVYFADPSGAIDDTATPVTISGDGTAYYPDGVVQPNIAPLLPGRYAIVGSSGVDNGTDYVSTVGRRVDAVEGSDLRFDQTRRIVLTPSSNPNTNQVLVQNNIDPEPSSDPTPADDPAPPVAAIAIPVNMKEGTIATSLSVSEPTAGYTAGNGWDPALADGEGAYATPIDEPLDKSRADGEDLMYYGTQEDFRMLHLQRLANPLAPWDAVENPYLTIDSMSVNLTVFNGLISPQDTELSGGGAPPPPVPNPTGVIAFETVERGSAEPASNQSRTGRQLWSRVNTNSLPGADTTMEVGAYHYFDYVLEHSLGFLNRQYREDTPVPLDGFPSDDDTLPEGGWTFPHLAWNNRPYNSEYELLKVPTTRSSQLTDFYGFQTGTDPFTNEDEWYPYLMNFFHSDNTVDSSSNLYRLFEYLQVPSPFVGTNKALFPTSTFYPPVFDKVSMFRDPGRININTVYDVRVWTALLAGYDGPEFDEQVTLGSQPQGLIDSRRGFNIRNPDPTATMITSTILPTLQPYNQSELPDSATAPDFSRDNPPPTYFANPFRAPGSGELVPLDGVDGLTNVTTTLQRTDIDATLMRSDAIDPGSSPSGDPLIESSSNEPHNDTLRNPMFRNIPLERMGSLVTTRSNVYAIWVTVGFFEVEPNDPDNDGDINFDRGHPDGYRLGAEAGIETGEVKRHRAFWIVDRSIPVAYEPGEQHNTDRAVLVRRLIE